MQVSLSDEAISDGLDAVDWYTDEGAFSAAGEFVDDLDHMLRLLQDFPEMGAPCSFNTRVLPLRNFPYSLVYRIQASSIRVIAIAHHSRYPGYWQGRR